MRKKTKRILLLIMISSLLLLILLLPTACALCAKEGLNLWFSQMIPALFPFMVLTAVMIRMDLVRDYMKLLKPILYPIFRVSNDCLYVIAVGFLCGFPMGAIVCAQLYERKRLTKKEAEYLLSFCNNIGPAYYLGYALPALSYQNKLPCLFGMYGIPFLYGILLRYTSYRKAFPEQKANTGITTKESFLPAFDEAVTASLLQIARIGGYMILFHLLTVLPSLFLSGTKKALVCGILEINKGLQASAHLPVFVSLTLLVFGGICCLFQVKSALYQTDLSLKSYVWNKMMLTLISFVYFLLITGSVISA